MSTPEDPEQVRHTGYPVRVDAELDHVSRWLWLVKWLLLIPHYFVLAFLWLGFVVLTVVAFFAILITAHYPRGIFAYNVGVIRWSWRVYYYGYAALGTDRYPPFTPADVPDYPARLEIDYPERLSRGLVLVKWWLLAIPQYIIVGVFAGGGLWLVNNQNYQFNWGAGGLIGILVLIAAIVLLCTGKYPKTIFDFVVGMDRWVVRVGVYAALMTDRYPPFRLDMGGHDPGAPARGPEAETEAAVEHHWTGGRIASVIVGSVLALVSMGLITGGATALWADRGARDADGYVTATQTFSSGGYAVTSGDISLGEGAANWGPASGVVGDIRIRASSTDPGVPVFVGIAPTGAVRQCLSKVDYDTVTSFGSRDVVVHNGTQQPAPPLGVDIWTQEASGPGTQTLSPRPAQGDWTVVVMNADGSRGLNVLVQPGATAPQLGWIGLWVLVGGIVLLAAGAVLIAVPAYRAAHQRPEQKV
ncbi:DUF4389 domain-containing protein [Amycolatopsis pigmentata]|uniref:DUF4389 domain-containing protein n=1 Tax=Amycolatopsis pigmentata TaxID=450801 RepID=A0ABW5FS88_9PSEU